MVFGFSEIIALMPYLLRSIRIYKISNAREEYYLSGLLPRDQIQSWNEHRIMKWLFITAAIIFFAVALLPVIFKDVHIVTMNLLEQPFLNNGLFDKEWISFDYNVGAL